MLSNRVMMAADTTIRVMDDGDHAPSSGAGTATHTYSSKTSTGPYTVLIITFEKGLGEDLTGVTWNGNAVTLAVNVNTDVGGSQDVGAAIGTISGAQSGDIVLTFNDGVDDSEITVLSLTNVRTGVVDTDSSIGSFTTALTLSLLTAPGVGGVRIAAFASQEDLTAITWTWSGSTEVSDLDAGGYRHSAAYKVENAAGNITATGGSADTLALVGVSIR